jgi:signal transduction histidine kinase
MKLFRAAALIGLAAMFGALGALLVAYLVGMPGKELRNLLIPLATASLITTALTAALARMLRPVSLQHRLIVLSVVPITVAATNVWVLARLMFVNTHDGQLTLILLLFSAGVGIGTSLVISRASATAFDRVAGTARALATGDLKARTGSIEPDPEIGEIATALDTMAERLEVSLTRERNLEARRRDLITAVSHDLRTPLASLQAMVEAIDEGVVADPPSLGRYAREMKASVGTLVGLVDDLFEFVQIDAGAIEAETERARLQDVVAAALETCSPTAEEKDLNIATNLEGLEGVRCSPRLVRVLQNLLTNAIRHTPPDGSVSIDASLTHGGLALVVEDDGDGIEADDLQRVFEPFWRAEGSRTGEGSGLGLALAARITEAMGGHIDATSEPLKGSRFYVWVPLAKPLEG